jgi:hypothetical protein
MMTVASTKRALATGALVNVPCPIRSKFEEL